MLIVWFYLSLTAMVTASQECEEDALRDLQRKVAAATRCFQAAKEKKQDKILATNAEHPNKNLKRQREQFHSTKRKRKKPNTKRKLVKPTTEERDLFHSTRTWELKPGAKDELPKPVTEISEGKC